MEGFAHLFPIGTTDAQEPSADWSSLAHYADVEPGAAVSKPGALFMFTLRLLKLLSKDRAGRLSIF